MGRLVVEIGCRSLSSKSKPAHYTCCALSPDGTKLVAGFNEVHGTVFTTFLRAFDVNTGKQVHSRRCGVTENYEVKEGDGSVLALRFSNDARTVVASHEGVTAQSAKVTCRCRAVAYDMTSFQLRLVGEHDEKILDLAISHDNQYVATAGQDRRTGIWSLAGGAGELCAAAWLEGHTSNVRSVDFSRDGRLVATAGHDCTGRIYRAEDGICVAVLEGHSHWIYGLRWAPCADGHLASVAADGLVCLWHLGEPTSSFGCTNMDKVLTPMQTLSISTGSSPGDLAWHNATTLAATSGEASISFYGFGNSTKLRHKHSISVRSDRAEKGSIARTIAISGDSLIVASRALVQIWDVSATARLHESRLRLMTRVIGIILCLAICFGLSGVF